MSLVSVGKRRYFKRSRGVKMYTQTTIWAAVSLFVIALLSGCDPGARPVSVGQPFSDLEGVDLLTGQTLKARHEGKHLVLTLRLEPDGVRVITL